MSSAYQTKPKPVDAWQVPDDKEGQANLVRTISFVGGEAYAHGKERVTEDYAVPAHISIRPHPFDSEFQQAFPGNWIVRHDGPGFFEVWSDEEFQIVFEAVKR